MPDSNKVFWSYDKWEWNLVYLFSVIRYIVNCFIGNVDILLQLFDLVYTFFFISDAWKMTLVRCGT